MKPPSAKGKLGGLVVKTEVKSSESAAVEDPFKDPKSAVSLEHNGGLDAVIEEEPEVEIEKAKNPVDIQIDEVEDTEKDKNRITSPEPLTPTSPLTSKSPPMSPTTPTKSKSKPPKRGATDPGAGVQRRKSMNPFTSFSNIKRSVVGSLSGGQGRGRSKSTRAAKKEKEVNGDESFDATHLPASPPLSPVLNKFNNSGSAPTEKRSVSAGKRSQTSLPPLSTRRPSAASDSQPPVVRQAVSPVMYNRGSILAEASAIEDEESRRMTELAFL